ncbi:MAG: hypothetical protein Kow0042_14750 [Calditrichia bacterium]
MTSTQLAEKVAKLAWQKKAQDIAILDLRKLTDVSDFFVITSGESELHVKAISEHIEEELKKANIRVWHKEGFQNLNWVLLDYIEVVVHIFRPQHRSYYSLERLWGDAPTIRLEENVPDRILFEKQD